MIIYLGLLLPTASSDLPESKPGKLMAFFLVLLRMGFTCAPVVTNKAVVSYTAFPPLLPQVEAVYFCCTSLGVTSTGRYPASCPVKPGLSSAEKQIHSHGKKTQFSSTGKRTLTKNPLSRGKKTKFSSTGK